MAIIDDKYMVYNYDYHMYIPTDELILNKLNVNLEVQLGSKTEVDIFLEDIAWFTKDFIAYYGNQSNVKAVQKQVEYLVYLNDQDQRRELQRAYLEMVRYAINDEGDMVGNQTGLNIVQGQVIPVHQLRGKVELSGRLERILRNTGLLYGGLRKWTIPEGLTYGVDY